MVKKDRLQKIKDRYFNNPEINGRIMYGSDFYLNMLGKIKFKNYYNHFRDVFTDKELENMSIRVPNNFLM